MTPHKIPEYANFNPLSAKSKLKVTLTSQFQSLYIQHVALKRLIKG